ncbi:MAG: M48 family metallopeptidase [Bacteroidia bacterium]|nr:M48 family metallopeptidase [Bacteroidia bacterium]
MTKADFKERVYHWAEKLDADINSTTVRPMKRKWASCSTRKHLTFNHELLSYSNDVVDYVIVHEILHCFVPNHGRLWKSLMRAHLGDYEEAERFLKVKTIKS